MALERISDLSGQRDATRTTNVDFLHASLQTAEILIKLAVGAGRDKQKRLRNVRSARRIYDRANSFRDRLVLAPDEKQTLEEELSRLRSVLIQLGETF